MKIQDIINELEAIKEEYGNLEVVTPSHGGRVKNVNINRNTDAERISVWARGVYKFLAIKVYFTSEL